MQSNFTIVTVASKRPTEWYYTYDQFFASLKRYNHEPLILGQQPGEYRGLGSKVKLLRKAILNNQIKSDYVIFCDCFDLVFVKSPELIMETFNFFNSPFVCSAEKNCFPADLKELFPPSPTSYRYLNSGFIVAEKDALLTVLESMGLDNVPDDYYDAVNNRNVHINDQFLMQQEFIKQPVRMVLDYRQTLCQTMHDVELDELRFNEFGIFNKETCFYPMAIHFNGNSKDKGCREPILNKLGL